MMKAGGEAKRKELVAQFEGMSLAGNKEYSKQDAAIAKGGEMGQSDYLTKAKQGRQKK